MHASCSKGKLDKLGFPFPEDLDKTFHPINDSLWRELEKGNITIDDIHANRWKRILLALGMEEEAKRGAELEKEFVYRLRFAALPVEGARELLDYLEGRYILCVGSNGPIDQQLRRLTDADMISFIGEERVFTSGEIGFSKPQKPFFDVCLDRLNGTLNPAEEPLRPEEILMIGDSLTADIGGAHDYGMKTIWYDHKHKGAQTPGAEKADVRVEDLADIMALL